MALVLVLSPNRRDRVFAEDKGAFVIDELTELVEEAVLSEFDKIAEAVLAASSSIF